MMFRAMWFRAMWFRAMWFRAVVETLKAIAADVCHPAAQVRSQVNNVPRPSHDHHNHFPRVNLSQVGYPSEEC